MREKANLNLGWLDSPPPPPKKKMGVTIQFSEIIELNFGRKCNTLLCISKLVRIMVA